MESEIFMVNLLVDLSDYGPTFLVTARCGPARRVVWEGGQLHSLNKIAHSLKDSVTGSWLAASLAAKR